MMKRLIEPIQRWFSLKEETNQGHPERQDADVSVTRRNFFKKAAFGAASIAGTAGIAKTVVDSMPKPDMKGHYIKDALAGEQELRDRDYVLMSDQEKAEMVQGFIDNHNDQA